MQAILVAPNNEERDILTYTLKHVGLSVAISVALHRVADKWLERPSDILVVVGQTIPPLISGLTALRTITQVPVLVLLERPTEEEQCDLLRAGADLVMSRPLSSRLLSEYLRTLLRRTQAVPTFVLPHLEMAEIKLDPDTRTVLVQGQEARRLTQLEFRLLYVLMVNRGQVIPVDVIVERVWGYTGQGSRELVRGLVSRLRRKIEPDAQAPRFIETIPGIGYRFSLETF